MLENELVAALIEKKLTIGSAESFTGGLFAKTITDVPGASKTFKGSLVSYSPEEKVRFLSINPEAIDKYGVVSKEIASQMAINGRKALNVDICVSFTGNAGPEALDALSVGTCFIAIASKKFDCVYPVQFSGTRQEIREAAVSWIIGELLKHVRLSKLG
jgi:nicotinamide-nucleotide amidase